MSKLNVNSEIGRLKTVLLHEPGEELNNLTPAYLGELLFDDIPWLPLAKKEHQAFAQTFKDANVKVVYLVDLVVESLDTDEKVKNKFINEYVSEAGINSDSLKSAVTTYLLGIKNTKDLVIKTMAGIKANELPDYKRVSLTDFVKDPKFITNPMPNLYFTRDPFVTFQDGIILNKMYSTTRCRETIYGKYIFLYHPQYKNTKFFYHRDNKQNIEGGDILVLSKDTLIIGVSERTSPEAIELLAKNLFYEYQTNLKRIIVLSIPKQRTFMHLDTIFTQIDFDKFTVHQECYEHFKVFSVEKDSNSEILLHTKELKGKLEDILSDIIGRKVTLIPCGGKDQVSADREQWSDGSNCVAIAPGEVITYERNNITNELLKSYGIKVHTIPSSELSRGRGGPRCMCMPLEREDII